MNDTNTTIEIEQRLAEVNAVLKQATDTINEYTKEYYDLMNLIRKRLGDQ